jgi:hypothetical protein
MAYQYSGTGQQSVAELQQLTTFVGDPLFRHADALAFSHTQEVRNIDAYLQNKANPFQEEYGWRQSSVKIRLPKEGMKWATETEAPELEIPSVYHRSIVDIIESVFMDNVMASFNMTPYCEYWPVRTLRGVSGACGTAGKLTGGLRQSFFVVSKSVIYGAGGDLQAGKIVSTHEFHVLIPCEHVMIEMRKKARTAFSRNEGQS